MSEPQLKSGAKPRQKSKPPTDPKPVCHQPPDAGALLHLRGNELAKGAPVALPLHQNSMFHLPGLPEAEVPFYGRVQNPTWEATEHALSHLEAAPTLLFPSGMGAIAAALFATCKSGSRLLVPADGYYVTRMLSQRFLANLGVHVTQRPTETFADGGFEGFDVVFIETPSNPGLALVDLRATANAVGACGGVSIADNTTMTPFGQRPLDLGVDIVVAADTKAPGGHSDLLLGHVSSRNETIMHAVEEWRKFSGSIPGPHDAWLLHRGLETLEVRFQRMCDNASALAPRLAAHKAVKSLRFPGLPSDPSHTLASQQMLTHGFLISLTLESDAKAEAFINACPMLRPATSFGGIHSSAERRIRWGDAVDPACVRLSVGIEPTQTLWQALKDSLDAVA